MRASALAWSAIAALCGLAGGLDARAESEPASASATAAAPADPSSTNFTLENSLNIRDPFRRPIPRASQGGDEGSIIPELERYELDKFKLVGVITGPRKNKAMVATPTGKMHIISENMHIGTRKGMITKIAPGMITVEEKVVNLLGQEEKVETTIEFGGEGEGN